MIIKTTDAILRLRFNIPQGGCVNFQPTINMLKKFNSEDIYNIEIEQEEILDVFSYVYNVICYIILFTLLFIVTSFLYS